MNVNATFFAELLAFSIFIFITYRYLWPSFSSILDSRREEISKGLEAASESQKKLEEAEDASRKMIEDAKNEASSLINQAGSRGDQIIEEGVPPWAPWFRTEGGANDALHALRG